MNDFERCVNGFFLRFSPRVFLRGYQLAVLHLIALF
jgi:hypothetical protein